MKINDCERSVYVGLCIKFPLPLWYFKHSRNVSVNKFQWKSQMWNFTKICSMGVAFIYTDRQNNWHNDANSRFLHNNALKKLKTFYSIQTAHLSPAHAGLVDMLMARYRKACSNRGLAPQTWPSIFIISQKCRPLLGNRHTWRKAHKVVKHSCNTFCKSSIKIFRN
jgi:hypothetical protein